EPRKKLSSGCRRRLLGGRPCGRTRDRERSSDPARSETLARLAFPTRTSPALRLARREISRFPCKERPCDLRREVPEGHRVPGKGSRGGCLRSTILPAEHWIHIRRNVIESSFATVRHRTDRAKGCLTRDGMLAMITSSACAPSAAGDDCVGSNGSRRSSLE